MEIRDRQQLGLPLGKPCLSRQSLAFRAMPIAARIISDAGEAAFRAALDMAAERHRAARLDRPHDAPFGATEMAGMHLAIGLAVPTEDVRHLEGGHDRGASAW